ncbi:glutathione peroxidase [Flavobacterium terrae]|uniref:Glutathione peroxidase n=1 Tax=Flavobacterium terrae TaxID=415425 RepID=A0A1M6CUX4_9FLAO|nr:glutathione peroxidase [Flavobacterium terrae]SHI64759.1 glutathione peroxidase [Flavobacterium terrae]
MKKKLLIVALMAVVTFSCKNQEDSIKNKAVNVESIQENTAGEDIYQFKVNDISGKEFDLASLKGKKVMIVNTASECGLTPQYEQLQALYDEFKGKNFVVIGFPSNDFANQEPGSNADIAAFCSKNYGVNFPMMEKISVKGESMHPLYQFLTSKAKNGIEENKVEWNFQKYLINEKGHLDKVLSPQTLPIDEVVINWISS